MSPLLFVYGSLLNPAVQEKVFGRIEEGVDDILEHHKTIPAFVEGQQYSTAIPDMDHNVHGKVLSLTDEELKKIDLYEEPEYRRKKVTLKSGTEAWLYTYRDHRKNSWR